MTPLRHVEAFEGYRNLFIKDESVNPNGTFKDRLSARALEYYERHVTFGVISYGNTAISLCRAIRRQSANQCVELVVFVPREFRRWSFGPSSCGTYLSGEAILRELGVSTSTISLDLTHSLTDSDLCILAMEAGLGRSRFINVTEGLEVPAYVEIIIEVIAQLGRPPDICVVPFGAGILCNEIKDYLYELGHGVIIPVSVACPNSLARMLYGPLWVDTELLRQTGVAYSRHRSPDRTGAERQTYPVFLIREDEIAQGLGIASTIGISAEPSGSAGLGVLHRLEELCPGLDRKRDTVVVINTGNGIDGFYRGEEQIECV